MRMILRKIVGRLAPCATIVLLAIALGAIPDPADAALPKAAIQACAAAH